MKKLWASLAGLAAAVPAAVYLWDFMVDDALITARYAHHISAGVGYRFNPNGAISDGVTPLGWAYLLAPFADSTLGAFHAAKAIGMAAWLFAAAALGRAIERLDGRATKWLALTLVLCSAPLGAWSVAGMETGVVLALACSAVCALAQGRTHWSALAAGLVAGLRPECIPWALLLALVPAGSGPNDVVEQSTRQAPPTLFTPARAMRLVISAAPFAASAIVRDALFGRPAPLAVYAKPSDLSHGGTYVLAGAIGCGLLAMVGWRNVPGWVRGLQACIVVHLLAVTAAGGDWMPLSRLLVVVLPSVVLVAAHLLGNGPRWITLPRLVLALAGPVFVFANTGPKAAGVGPKRLALIGELAPTLKDSHVIGALDIGWVGAAAPHADILDFAGVTDPAVAALRGSHTNKPIGEPLLTARKVDTMTLWLADEGVANPWTASRFARGVEWHVVQHTWVQTQFEPVAVSQGALHYLVIRRQPSGYTPP